VNLGQVLNKTTEFFRQKNLDSPRLDAEVLLAAGLGLKRMDLYLRFEQPVSDEELSHCRELVRRRATGEPVSIILGFKDFYGRRFRVNQNVLTPRPETELLVEQAVLFLRQREELGGSEFQVADLGSGSGCIGLTIAAECPLARVVCVEKSREAVQVLQENAQSLGVSDRVQIICADVSEWAKDTTQKFDLVTANPPYIASDDPHVDADVKTFEPAMALFADDQGFACLKSWSTAASKALKDSSMMIMELGWTQGPEMKKYYDDMYIFSEVKILKDYSGHDRMIVGTKNK
jgi:release factor glutamine methyltransferase